MLLPSIRLLFVSLPLSDLFGRFTSASPSRSFRFLSPVMANNVSSVYIHVVDDVISKVRDEFINFGVGENILSELQALWEMKMVHYGAISGAIERPSPAQKPVGPITPVHDLNVPYEGPTTTEEYETLTAEMLFLSVIITEAAKSIQEARSWKSTFHPGEGLSTPTHMRSLTEVPAIDKFQSPGWKVKASPRCALFEGGGVVPGDFLLNKLEEIRQSVKKIESFVDGC